MNLQKVSGANAPYRLRAHKGIERSLFVELLKIIDGSSLIDLSTYRYVGFAASSLEDFKMFHYELGIVDMHSIEKDEFAFSRQEFNNPFQFLTPMNTTSTKYIAEEFESGKNHVVWLDYTDSNLKQQLKDLEILSSKLNSLDILKVTFNAHTSSFIKTYNIESSADSSEQANAKDWKAILKFLRGHPTYELYLPSKLTGKDVSSFSELVRAMAVRAIKRGLSKNIINTSPGDENPDKKETLEMNHISAFDYADGQVMTTMTAILSSSKSFANLKRQSKIKKWAFFRSENNESELIEARQIIVPDMTVSERTFIEKQLPSTDIKKTALDLPFKYGKPINQVSLIDGYETYYKYLPYFGKVTY